MASPPQPADSTSSRVRIVVATSVMLTFISFWRAAAIVLSDLASSAYYVGGDRRAGHRQDRSLVHPGRDAVLLSRCAPSTSSRARCSCAAACTAWSRRRWAARWPSSRVSALLFDYILTGPISAVAAGQYVAGLSMTALTRSITLACNITAPDDNSFALCSPSCTLYFWWQNTQGIHESSERRCRS